jgi:C4-dicarboxylate-specific signal transduction histidine kinase
LSRPIQRRQSLHLQLQENEDRIHFLEEQIATAQTLAALGTATAKIAHEINNVLMLMTNYAKQALARQDDIAFMRKALEKTIHHCNQAAGMIDSANPGEFDSQRPSGHAGNRWKTDYPCE